MAVDHYENFPVASLLLPRALHEPVAAIYAFARSADDLADEGVRLPERRLEMLADYRREIEAIEQGRDSDHPMFLRLRSVVVAHDLPLWPFHDLLDAFTQDVVKTRYTDFAELTDYCRRSANPVGRLMLRLFRADSVENLQASDAICTALQLINHWQDVAIDWRKGRVYLPREDLARFGVDEPSIADGVCDRRWRELMRFEVDRARVLMLSGEPLGRRLAGRCAMELRAIVAGGMRILEKIEAVDYDVFRRRPELQKADWLRILWRAL
jgi:phytoene synthase